MVPEQVKKIAWDDAASQALELASEADNPQAATVELRQRWERGELALFSNGGGYLVAEVVERFSV